MTERVMNYAKVLFDLNISDECVQNTNEIILKSIELQQAFSNPAIKKNEKHAVIDAIFDKSIKSFLKVICDNECMELIGQIFDTYESLVLESKNIIKATLAYVTRPDEDQLEKIKRFVCTEYKKTGVLLELKEEPSLLGGFILSVGDMEYDKSIRGTLSSLNKTLMWR